MVSYCRKTFKLGHKAINRDSLGSEKGIFSEIRFIFDIIFKPSAVIPSGKWGLPRALVYYYILSLVSILISFVVAPILYSSLPNYAAAVASAQLFEFVTSVFTVVLLFAPIFIAISTVFVTLLGLAFKVPYKRFFDLLECFLYGAFPLAFITAAIVIVLAMSMLFDVIATAQNLFELTALVATFALMTLWPIVTSSALISYKFKIKRVKALVMSAVLLCVFLLAFGLFIQLTSTEGPSTLQGTTCIAGSGFYCGGLAYSHTTGNLIVSLGQNTGTNWTAWGIAYAPQGTDIVADIPKVKFSPINSSDSSARNYSLPSGMQVFTRGNILPASASSIALGTATSGAIWVCFTTASGVTSINGGEGYCTPIGNSTAKVQYAQIATLTAKAS
ncbi:Uncharacterised protein [uncultured archaeon]|nr:Uncharacterised protein [uncultured archaeon]